MQSFEKWRENMRGVYGESTKSAEEIERINPSIPESQGGYLIILRHSEEISEKIANFSERVSNCVPAVKYDKDTIHTTVSDYLLGENFEPDYEILKNLSDTVSNVRGKRLLSIDYSEWLYNSNTVLVAGEPNHQFLAIAEEVKANAQKKEIDLRLPWGAHITTNRFAEEKTRKELSDFFELIKEAPVLGTSKPQFIDVGYFTFSEQVFKVTPYERFNLA